MTNKQEIIKSLKLQFPTLRVGDEDKGYTELSSKQYEAQIAEWADAKLNAQVKEVEAEAKAQAKAELLERLGITADEAKLLLA
jgi:hypothetical protein